MAHHEIAIAQKYMEICQMEMVANEKTFICLHNYCKDDVAGANQVWNLYTKIYKLRTEHRKPPNKNKNANDSEISTALYKYIRIKRSLESQIAIYQRYVEVYTKLVTEFDGWMDGVRGADSELYSLIENYLLTSDANLIVTIKERRGWERVLSVYFLRQLISWYREHKPNGWRNCTYLECENWPLPSICGEDSSRIWVFSAVPSERNTALDILLSHIGVKVQRNTTRMFGICCGSPLHVICHMDVYVNTARDYMTQLGK
jgi:hypothetical protein